MTESRKRQFSSSSIESAEDAAFAEVLESFAGIVLDGDERRIETFLEAHAEVRDRLRGLVPAMRAMAPGIPNGSSDTVPTQMGENAKPARHLEATNGLSAGMQLGDFRVVRELGRGGMGVVYEADQLSMQRKVALKVLPFAALAGEKSLKRFHNEVRAAALLDHPHVVSVYSVGEERGIHYYAMQLVRGQSLAAVIEYLRVEKMSAKIVGRKPRAPSKAVDNLSGQERLKSEVPREDAENTACRAGLSTEKNGKRVEFYRQAARLGIQAADALQHAHEQGVIHRDIKPANLLLDAMGQLRVTDFGLANIENDVNLTATGEMVGTLRYMSPEQALGPRGAQDHRSDIYSLGATLYELLTSRPVVVGDDRGELLRQIQDQAPHPPRHIDSSIPADLETIVLKALENDPRDRYQTAEEFSDDLRRFVAGQNIRAVSPSLANRFVKWARRNVALVTIGAFVTMLLCVVLAASTLLILAAKQNTQWALEESRKHAEDSENLRAASDLQLAMHSLDSGRPAQAVQIIERQNFSSKSLQSQWFEWQMLKSLTRRPESRVIGQHEGSANEMAIFPDGQRMASVGDDGELMIWHLDSGRLNNVIDTGNEPLHAVAISLDGQTIATGGKRLVQLWNVTSGKQELILTEHEATVESLAFSPDGKRIATASRYDEVRVFSTAGRLLKTLKDGGRHMTLEFSGNGRLLVPRHSGRLQIWHEDMTLVHSEIGESPINCDLFTLSPSGEWCLISDQVSGFQSSGQPHTALFHVATGKDLLRLPPYAANVKATALSPNDLAVAVGFSDGNVHHWNLRQDKAGKLQLTGSTLAFTAHHGSVNSVKLISDKDFVTCGADGKIKLWRLTTGDNPRRFGRRTDRLAISPDGKTIASIQGNERLKLYSTHGEMIQEASSEGGWIRLNVLSYSVDGRMLVTTNDTRSELQFRDSKTCKLLDRLQFESSIEDVAFAPSSETLAVCTYANSTVHFVDLQSLQIVHQTALGVDRKFRCCFSRDGRSVVCGGGDRLIVLDEKSGQIIRETTTSSQISCLVLTPSGQTLITGHYNGQIDIWDFPALACRASLMGHEDAVRNLACHPNGQTLASASSDGTLRLWSLSLNREWGVLDRTKDDKIYWDVAFSKDGNSLIAASDNARGLAIFSLTPEQHPSLPDSINWEFARLPFHRAVGLADAGYDFAMGIDDCVWISDYELHRIDVANRKLVDVFSPRDLPWRLISGADECPRLALANNQRVVVYDYEDNSEVASWSIDEDPHKIDITPDGRFVAVARSQGEQAIQLLDVDNPDTSSKFFVKDCSCLRFSPCGEKLIAGIRGHLILLEKGADDQWSLVRRISSDAKPNDIALSPDGYTVATARFDQQIQLFDARTGRPIRISKKPLKGKCFSIDFSACGQLIATGGSDKTVKILDAERLEQLHEFPASGPVTKLRFAQEGYRLFARVGRGVLVDFDTVSIAKPPRTNVSKTGDGASFSGLGRPQGIRLRPRAISADGNQIIGYSNLHTNSIDTAFRWSPDDGVVLLLPPDGFNQSWATIIGEDTRSPLIGGYVRNSFGTAIAVWHDDERTPATIEQPREWRHVIVFWGEGSVMGGYGEKFDVRGRRAITYDGITLRELPGLVEGHNFTANGVSRNSDFVLGQSWTGNRSIHASTSKNLRIIRWIKGKPEFLPGLVRDAPFNWRALGLSTDARVVVGCRWPYGCDGGNTGLAFRWELGEVHLLGDLPGGRIQSYATAMSADGRVIVGRSDAHDGRQAFIWDPVHGMRRLDHVLVQYGAKVGRWRLTEARAVSADGRSIAGIGYNSRGRYDAFVAKLPEEAFSAL